MVPDIAIILVTYAAADLTTACLDSLAEVSLPDAAVHIVVVDNGSPTPYELPKRFAEHKKLDITLLRSASNLGFTGGNNLGIHAAIERFNSDFVMLLNNDTIVAPDFLEKLLAAADQRPLAGLICPKIYFAKGREFFNDSYLPAERGKVLWYAGGTIDWANLDSFHRGVDELDRGQFHTQLTSEFATGCCVLIRREALEKIGLLDKRFYLYYEDADWSFKAKICGYEIGYCDEAIVWHINAGSSSGAGSVIHQYYQTRNRLLFFWRYGSWRTKLTVAAFAARTLIEGTETQQKAIWHFLTGKRGKQPLS